MLLLCSSQMYWAVSVMSVPNLARVHVERVESFFSFFSSLLQLCSSHQFVSVLGGTSERAWLSFYYPRRLDSVGLNSVD